MVFIPPAPANHRNSAILVASTSITVTAGNDAWGENTVIGTVSLSTSALTELKVGTTGLDGRHTLYLTNDSSKLLFIKSTTTLGSSDAILVNSGVAATIKLNPNENQKIYGRTFTGLASIKVMEMKN
jgi:hypothetical protein